MHLFHSTVLVALLCWSTCALCELTLADPARKVGGRLWNPRTYSPDDVSNAQSHTSSSAASDSTHEHRHLQAGCGVYPNPVSLARSFSSASALEHKI
jgi:hypothetical protein